MACDSFLPRLQRSFSQLAQLNEPFLANIVLSRTLLEERLMKTKTARPRLRRHARSFSDCIREFLTPALWKQAHDQRHSPRRSSRWSTQPLILVLLFMTWSCGDSQPERFETARAFCVVCLPKRRRPGRTVQIGSA